MLISTKRYRSILRLTGLKNNRGTVGRWDYRDFGIIVLASVWTRVQTVTRVPPSNQVCGLDFNDFSLQIVHIYMGNAAGMSLNTFLILRFCMHSAAKTLSPTSESSIYFRGTILCQLCVHFSLIFLGGLPSKRYPIIP